MSNTIKYTDPALVSSHSITETPRNPYVSGYGPKVPTRHMITYASRTRRVYVAQYGNSGSAYINVKGERLFLDTDTEHKLYSTN